MSDMLYAYLVGGFFGSLIGAVVTSAVWEYALSRKRQQYKRRLGDRK